MTRAPVSSAHAPGMDLANAVRLRGSRVVDGTNDLDELATIVSRTTRPTRFEFQHGGAVLNASADVLAAGGLHFTRMSYGADLFVMPGETDSDTFMIPISVVGETYLRYGRQRFAVSALDSAVVPPYREFQSELSAEVFADSNQVLIAISRTRVESAATQLLASGIARPRGLEPGPLILSPAVVGLLVSIASMSVASPEDIAYQRRVADVAVEGLLLAIPQIRSMLSESSGVSSMRVRRATQFMRDHLGEPMTLSLIATSVGVTPRALQLAFRSELDESPMQWLRERRLEKAWDSLTQDDPHHLTIAAIAHSCGFLHLGEFSAAFKRKFGVLPSQARRETKRM